MQFLSFVKFFMLKWSVLPRVTAVQFQQCPWNYSERTAIIFCWFHRLNTPVSASLARLRKVSTQRFRSDGKKSVESDRRARTKADPNTKASSQPLEDITRRCGVSYSAVVTEADDLTKRRTLEALLSTRKRAKETSISS